jgi:putative FmdB family regulatory protein
MVYEYQCKTCKSIIEKQQRIGDDPIGLTYCKVCGRMRQFRKLISKTSFILKGGAWAKDGYCKVI